MRIYRVTDRIKYKLGDLTIEVSPLSLENKSILHSHMVKAQGGDVAELMAGSVAAIKMCLKSVKGLENADGSPYELSFENNQLTDECVSELMNMQETNSLIALCSSFIGGVPKDLPKGVTLVEEKNPAKKSKG